MVSELILAFVLSKPPVPRPDPHPSCRKTRSCKVHYEHRAYEKIFDVYVDGVYVGQYTFLCAKAPWWKYELCLDTYGMEIAYVEP